MERYFHNEPDDDDDDDDDDDENEDMEHFVQASKSDIMNVMQMEIAEQELNEKLLDQSYRIASTEWKWIFRSTTYKMRKIQRIFNRLKRIVSEE